MQAVHLKANRAKKIPWKNGRGFTHELAIWPAGATLARDDFDWRVSKATVDEPGPFSIFRGFERVLVVTSGDGIVLSHGSSESSRSRARLRALEPYRFSGDWKTDAELTGGPIADFNVLARRGSVRANVECLSLGRRRARESIAPSHALVHVASGKARARVTGEEEPFELATGDSLWVQALEREMELDLAGTADGTVLLLVRVEPDDDRGADPGDSTA